MSMEIINPNTTISYQNASLMKKESVWEALDKITLRQSIDLFLKSLKEGTAECYMNAFNNFFIWGFLDPNMTLRQFSMINLESKLDQIRVAGTGMESTKQTRAAGFISFTGFLQRKTEGMIKKTIPNKEKGRKTFQKMREKTVCDVLTPEELRGFLAALKGISLRSYLIGGMQVQGAKRISEVLNSGIGDIDWKEGSIRFKQSKSDILEKETVVFFSVSFMEELKDYLGDRSSGSIFITSSGRKMGRSDIQPVYERAFKRAGINKRGFTHILRATTITELCKQGFGAEEIVNLSGHSSLQMVGYYDKSGAENNPSRKVNMI